MGVLQKCYSQDCRWYEGGPVGKIRYYFVPWGNRLLPDPNVFWPRAHWEERDLVDDGHSAGPVINAQEAYDRGANYRPDLVGDHPAGTADDFGGITELPPFQPPPPSCISPPPLWGVWQFVQSAYRDPLATPDLWLRNADLPPGSALGEPFHLWPAAPLTTRFMNSDVPVTLTILDGSFTALALRTTYPDFPRFSARTNISISPFVAPHDYTVLMAARGVGSVAGIYLLDNLVGSGHPVLYSDFSGTGIQASGVIFSPSALPVDSPSVTVWRCHGANREVWRNRALLVSDSSGGGQVTIRDVQVTLGATTAAFASNLYELIAFSRALRDSELATLWDYLQPFMPGDDVVSGTIIAYGGSTVPANYLACDGSAVSRATFAALFAAIGVTWGPGDGSTTFQLPDLRGRALVGSGSGGGLTPRPLADLGGEEQHTLLTTELAPHDHTLHDPGHSHALDHAAGIVSIDDSTVTNSAADTNNGNTNTVSTGITMDLAGGGAGHNNMQPFAVVGWIIKT